MHSAATVQTASIWTADTEEVKRELTELSALAHLPLPLTVVCLLEHCTVTSDCNQTVSLFSSSSIRLKCLTSPIHLILLFLIVLLLNIQVLQRSKTSL